MPKGYAMAEATKDAIWELRAQGLSDREVGRRLGLPLGSVSNHLARTGGIRPRARRRPERCLTARRARGDLTGDRPRPLGPPDRPGPGALPHDDRP